MVPVHQAIDVAREALGVGQDLVREGHRLGRLKVREASGRRHEVVLCLGQDGVLQLRHARRDDAGMGAKMKLQVVGGLVVARPPRPELAAEGAEPRRQHTLQEGVDVLVGRGGGNAARRHILTDGRQRALDLGPFRDREDAGALELAGVGRGGA